MLGPVFSLVRKIRPDAVITTEDIGLAMLEVARRGASKTILDTADLKAIVAKR